MLLLCVAIILICLYLIPIVVALYRRAKHADAIVVCTFLLGWTGIGWVGSLLWAMCDPVAA